VRDRAVLDLGSHMPAMPGTRQRGRIAAAKDGAQSMVYYQFNTLSLLRRVGPLPHLRRKQTRGA
jgi:hypothetical protein